MYRESVDMPDRKTNIFITGPIHSGKTTVINRVIENLNCLKLGGFRTVPIFENGKKTGFCFAPIGGSKQCFAHTDMNSENQFDIYRFNLEVFETSGVAALQQGLQHADLILMDEIGMMEQQTKRFHQLLINCLDSHVTVLGVVQQRAHWFLKILQNRPDTQVFAITPENRSGLPEEIITLIEGATE